MVSQIFQMEFYHAFVERLHIHHPIHILICRHKSVSL